MSSERDDLIARTYNEIRRALVLNEQRSFMEQVQEAATSVVDALLAPRPDGSQWMLVRPATDSDFVFAEYTRKPRTAMFVRAGVEKES